MYVNLNILTSVLLVKHFERPLLRLSDRDFWVSTQAIQSGVDLQKLSVKRARILIAFKWELVLNFAIEWTHIVLGGIGFDLIFFFNLLSWHLLFLKFWWLPSWEYLVLLRSFWVSVNWRDRVPKLNFWTSYLLRRRIFVLFKIWRDQKNGRLKPWQRNLPWFVHDRRLKPVGIKISFKLMA